MSDELYRRIVAGDHGAYYDVVVKQATYVISKRGAPPGLTWKDDHPEDMAQEFWASGRADKVLLLATDDNSLRALVRTALKNMVVDEKRKSIRGGLARRLAEFLRKGPFKEKPPGFWRKDECPDAAFGGREADLLEVAWAVEVRMVRWRPTAEREAPLTDEVSLLRLLDAILTRANGAVELVVLVNVIASRLGVGPAPRLEQIDTTDAVQGLPDKGLGPEGLVIAIEDEVEGADRAMEIWAQLTADERRMIPHLETSSREAGDALGWGRTKAAKVQRRLEEVLRVLLSGLPEQECTAAFSELRSLADSFR